MDNSQSCLFDTDSLPIVSDADRIRNAYVLARIHVGTHGFSIVETLNSDEMSYEIILSRGSSVITFVDEYPLDCWKAVYRLICRANFDDLIFPFDYIY